MLVYIISVAIIAFGTVGIFVVCVIDVKAHKRDPRVADLIDNDARTDEALDYDHR